MAFNQILQPANFCSNCGTSGHVFRQCVEPVSSYGVLVFRWVSRTGEWPQTIEFCKDTRNPTGVSNLIPQVLMIQRKDSLGFMDIMRGKYKVNEPEYISKQLRGMTIAERNKLLNDDFEKIWDDLWGSDKEISQRYSHNHVISKQKLYELRSGVLSTNGTHYTLADLLRQEPSLYETPEWGFPKGRRDLFESDIQCAYRELHEETGISEENLFKVVNIAPLIEQFYGSNNIHYRHSYYIAQYVGKTAIGFDALNPEMAREIGNLSWKNLDEALVLLRPDNVEKRGILVQLANILRNFSPVLRSSLTAQRLITESENTNGEQQERYVFVSTNSSHATGHGTGHATGNHATGNHATGNSAESGISSRSERTKGFFATKQRNTSGSRGRRT